LKISVEDKAEYIISGLPPDDFPKFGVFPEEGLIEIPAGLLKILIERTIFSVSYDDRKYALSGILTEIIPTEEGADNHFIIRMVSSYGHRLNLAEKEIDINVPPEGMQKKQSAIIPRKGENELKKFAEDSKIVFLKKDEKFLYARNDKTQLIIRLINGTFPDYKAIIPKKQERYFEFSRKIVLGALKRISIMSPDPSFKGVTAKISSNIMELESMEKKTGQAQEIINIKYSGEHFEVAFNARYLIEVLQIMKSENVEFNLNDDNSPCIIRGEEDKGFMAVIMPISLEDE